MTNKQKEKNDLVLLAETNFRNQRVKFGIKTDDRRRHMYLIGKTGMGKSTAMENMIIQDINNGQGLALVDPHGDLAEKILDFIPNNRINDVIYFNPSDMDFPIAFNVMESISIEHKHLVASGLVGVFKKLWADSWGPRLEYLLRNAILALLDYPGSTLLGVMRILVDKTYRKKVIAKIEDPVVKAFWVEEFSKYPQQFQVEAVAPIQNKVGQFLSTALIRNVVGQVKSSFDLREVMDNQKILIMNLSKGRIGEDSSALLGAMMITKIQLAAMSRIDTAEDSRKDFYLYVDEFQNFATESFANILSEARKYRLNLIIGHQYIEQLDEIVSAAVFGNVGTLMCFRVGSADAEALETEFTPYFAPEDLVNLTKYDVYMKLMIDGVSSNPFSATTLPPLGGPFLTKNQEKVIQVSRERYAKPRDVVEDKINRWSGVMTEEDLKERRQEESKMEMEVHQKRVAEEEKEEEKINREIPAPKAADPLNKSEKPIHKKEEERKPKKKKNKVTYTAKCYECGDQTEISFKPDGIRPIYCQKCFHKIKEQTIHGDSLASQIASTPPEPELSLSEALTKKPINFDQNKKPGSETEITKVKLPSQSVHNNSNNAGHSVKPGEVIKL